MKIRSQPSDFTVEEILRDDVMRRIATSREGVGYAVYRLTKTSLTTDEAIRRFARAAGVRPGAVAYAGLKDKHALTIQHISVAAQPGTMNARVTGEGWTGELAGWSNEPAAAAWIRRNRFRLVVRDLTPAMYERMNDAAAYLAMGTGTLLIVNYFGDQRFGSARHGGGFAGARLARNDFEGAVRLLIGTPARKDTGAKRDFARAMANGWGQWSLLLTALPARPERRAVEVLARGGGFREAFAALPAMLQQMAVEAYQSHLWNGVARRLASGLAEPTATAGRSAGAHCCIVTADAHGNMVYPAPGRVAGGWRTLELPMLAASTKLTPPWKSVAEDVLAEEGLSLAQLVVPGLRRPAFGEAWRPFVVMVERFEMSEPRLDAAGRTPSRYERTVSFELPRGSYATVVLRALEGRPA